MKKIISTMLAAALSLPLTANTVNSADISPELPIVHFTGEKETDTDLYALASSLGADTDYFDILNYYIGENFPGNDESYSHFTNTADSYDAHLAYALFGDAISGGACMGISILEILAHNGVISPSDIEEGAETLHDIGLTTESDKYITSYQAAQLHFELDFYERYFVSNFTPEQQVDRLIEMAERNMAENRYFLITIHSDLHHAVVGMGITDGKWNYNGVDYDKCVLTLDSNAMDSSGSAKGFSEKSCIYINSETKQAYIPAYEADSTAENELDRLRISSIDDDTMLNYRGMINPSKEIKTDLSDMDILTLGMKQNTDYRVTITDADGTVHGLEEPVYQLSQLSRYKYFTSGREFHIEGNTIDSDYSMVAQTIYLKNQRGYSILESYDAMSITYDITKEGYRVKSNDGELLDYFMQIWLNDEYNPCLPNFHWAFDGWTTSEVSFEPNENGILLSSDSLIETIVDTAKFKYNENGLRSQVLNNPDFNITAAGNVMVTVDDENKVKLFIDPDNDGVYDTAVEKGDVDSNGVIDATDASYVLSAYSFLSTGKRHFLNEEIADYNGDGAIDSSDASQILAEYARHSTN